MNLKGKVLLQLLRKASYETGPKRYCSQNFFLYMVKFKKLGFSAPLTYTLK